MRNSSHHHIGFWSSIALVTILSLAMIIFPTTQTLAQSTERVNLHSDGVTEGDDISSSPSISADGRFVAFASKATNLVDPPSGGNWNIFVLDRTNNQTTRVTLGLLGAEPNGACQSPSISANGRYVAFDATANNLTAGAPNNQRQVYVYDRDTGQTVRVSEKLDGTPGDAPSIVAFRSWATNLAADNNIVMEDIFVRDRDANVTTLISRSPLGAQSNESSDTPSISADGRFVGYRSNATNLVADDNNGRSDIFVYDQLLETTTRVSVNSNDEEGDFDSYSPSLSADGRYVAFHSDARNQVANNTNLNRDVFHHDLTSGKTIRASIHTDGATEGDNASDYPSISWDGRFVAFSSAATNLVADDTNVRTDVFVRDVTGDPPIIKPNPIPNPNNPAPAAGGGGGGCFITILE